MTYQTLFLSSLIANNALKRKLGAICVLRRRKKVLKIQKSKNFDVFSFSKYDISRTVAPILMIFFANCWQFNSLIRLKEKSFENFQNFEKNLNLQFSTEKRKFVNSKTFWFFTNFWSFLKLFLFLSKRKIKLWVVCKKDHQNRRNGSGDIVLWKWKNIKIFRLLNFQGLFSTPEDTNGPQFSF